MEELRKLHKNNVVVGLQALGAEPVPRLDIDELLLEHPNTFNLFALAFDELLKDSKTKDSSNPMGYYQIAGIHGLPKASWNGIDFVGKHLDERAIEAFGGGGYCHHGMITFPTWHRPYVAMIEQTIYIKMLDVAEKFPESHRPTYREAAKQFRLPYWDYHNPRAKDAEFNGIFNGKTTMPYDFHIPWIFTRKDIMLRTTAENKLESYPNPFLSFSFPTNQDMIPDPQWGLITAKDTEQFSRIKTARYPTEGADQVKQLNSTLNKQRENAALNFVRMMKETGYADFRSFATAGAGAGRPGSLEAVHGWYHGFIGGLWGHMSKVPVAAFDPVFWFHHCQIDRIFAIWQAIHPDKWFENDTADLLPFQSPKIQKSTYQFWKSKTSQLTTNFGYIYKDAQGNALEVLKNFRQNYEWSVREEGRPEYGKLPDTVKILEVLKAPVFSTGSIETTTSAVSNVFKATKQVMLQSAPEFNITSREIAQPAKPVDTSSTRVSRGWFVDFQVERLALNGAFAVYFFLGPTPPESVDYSEYFGYSTLAGASHIFAAPVDACDSCGQQAEQAHLIDDSVPLTPILLDYVLHGDLPDLSPANVTEFLVKNLKWRIITNNGVRADPRTVAGFKLEIISSSKPMDNLDQEPTYDNHPDIARDIIANSS